MWKDESRQAMQAFMDGDELLAEERWGSALALAEKDAVPPCEELGQIYYFLGKIRWDRKDEDAAIPFLESAVRILDSVRDDSVQRCESSYLSKAQYDLAAAYRRTNQEGKAAALFRRALTIEDRQGCLPLKDALKVLHKCKLAKDLQGEILENLCKQLDLDPQGDNGRIVDLLRAYYAAVPERAVADKFIETTYDYFDLEYLIPTLSKYIGKTGKVKIVSADVMPQMEDQFNLELQVDGDDSFFQQVCSVDDIFDVFNDILLSKDSKVLFQKLDHEDLQVSCFCLLKESTVEKLEADSAVPFIDLTPYD